MSAFTLGLWPCRVLFAESLHSGVLFLNIPLWETTTSLEVILHFISGLEYVMSQMTILGLTFPGYFGTWVKPINFG